MQLIKNKDYICTVKKEETYIDFENSIGPWLGKTIKIIEYNLHELFKENGIDLTKEQMVVLKKLHEKDGLSQNELAFLVLRNKSSLTRLLLKMEKKNYITRKKSNKDKRINNVYLTDFGKSTFSKSKPIIQQLICKMEEDISTSDKQQIIKTLKKIQSNFNTKIESL